MTRNPQSQRAEAIQRARARRAELVVGREDLVAAIEALLFERDPVGINFDVNPDEYRLEAESIVIRLPDARTEADARHIVYDEFTRWFGITGAGPRSRYDEIAAEIWTMWTEADAGD